MGDNSKIEWTDASWNPIVGCSRVSEGCRNCYAYSLHDMRHKAFSEGKKLPQQYAKPFNEVQTFSDRLDMPLRWKRPRKIFVNSLSDLFHDSVPDEFIRSVFKIMGEANWHTFQVLTKRPDRMKRLLNSFLNENDFATLTGSTDPQFPWQNVWLGVSVENQKAADERIPLLLQTPAVVRFLSMEPLLGVVNLDEARCDRHGREFAATYNCDEYCTECVVNGFHGGLSYGHWLDPLNGGISWVIVGGESGSKARPVHPDWIRSIRDQCQDAGVPFFFKQWGEFLDFQDATCPDRVSNNTLNRAKMHTFEDGTEMLRVGKHNAGRELDGRTWNEFPLVHEV